MPNRYPKLAILSKNELAKHISHRGFIFEQALQLINDVRANFSKYWKDSKMSEPEKEKYVRSAKGTPLGILLRKLNVMVLAPHDRLLPNFIFGGVSGLDHVRAAANLLGRKRQRTLLKIDITRFFEQVKYGRVVSFFRNKSQCSIKAARLLADLCCLPLGPKGTISSDKAIARGFATSSRLAAWCNLDIFLRLDWLIKKELKGHDPRLTIYVDDIGVTASRVSKEQMENLYIKIRELLEEVKLPLNDKKTKISSHEEGMDILGTRLGRRHLFVGGKSMANKNRLIKKLKQNLTPQERRQEKTRYKSTMFYKRYVESTR